MPKTKTKTEILIELEQAHKRIAELEAVGVASGHIQGGEAQRESEQRLRSMLEVSQAMAASLEMDTVLQKIIENATGLLQLDSGAIYTLEGDQLFLQATTPPLPPGFPDELRCANVKDHPHIHAAISSGTAVALADATTAELSGAEKMAAEARGLRSIIYVPLMISEKAIGVFIVASVDRIRTFREEEIALYSGFSGQAAQTIVNARLYNLEREYASKLEMQINERKQAEAKVRESESRYRLIAENSADVIWVLDPTAGKFTYVSPSVQKLRGYTPEEVMAQPMDEVLTAESLKRVSEALAANLPLFSKKGSGTASFISEVDQPCKDGSIVNTEVTTTYMFNEQGGVEIVGVSRNITERKRAEEKLRDSEKKYRDLLNGMNDSVWVIDADMSFLDINETAIKTLGYSRDELLLMKVSDIDDAIEPAQIQALIDRLQEEKLQIFETRHKTKDGRVIPVEVSSSLVSYMGRTVIMSISRDIADRKRAEEVVRLAEQRYRALIENAPDGVVLIDLTGKFKYASPSVKKLFGYEQDEAMGGDPNAMTHPDDLPTVINELAALIEDPSRVPTLQYRFKHKNGEWRWIESTFSNLLMQPSVEAIIINFRDIHERKLAEEALAKSQALLTEAQRIGRIGHMEWVGIGGGLLCSDELYDILELPRDTTITKQVIGRMLLPGEEERIHALEMLAIQTHTDMDYEYRILTEGGKEKWLHQIGKATYGEDGQPVRMMFIVQDITERKQTEEKLRSEQTRLAKLADTIPGAILTFQLTPDGLLGIPYASKAFEDIYGIPQKDVRENINAIIDRVPADQVEQLLQAVQESMETMQPWRREYEYHHPQKGRIWLEGMSMPVKEADDTVLWHGVTSDITKRKQVETNLRESRTRLEMALEGAKAGMWDWNVQTGETIFNERWAEIVGYSLAELEPISIKTWADLCHPDDLKRSEELLQKHFSGEVGYYECEARMKHKNGSWVWVMDQGRVMEWDENGNPIRMFGTHLDITRQKREELYTQALLRLTDVSYAVTDMNDLIRAMLDEAEELTDSAVGFFHFVDNDQNTIKLQAWSTNTLMNLCAAEGQGQHYPVEQAGVWADAVRSGEARIYNDYPSLAHRKGLPEGHAPIARLVTLPVKRNDLVVAALGIGNKVQEYTDQDLEVLQRLADTVFDIIMRKRVEETLRNNEERLRTVADFTYDMEFWMDETKTLAYISPSCERITGYKREQFLNDPALLQKIVHPEDRSVFDQHSMQEFELQGSCTLDFRILTVDGEVRWINHTCQAVTRSDGKFRGRRVSHRDITERRHALQELRASEEKYRGLLESLDSVVASMDLEGKFLYMNDTAAGQLGGTPEQFIGMTMYELFPEPVADLQMGDIKTVIAADKGRVFENPTMINGKLRWYRTSIQPLHDENGQVFSVLVNSTDIHDLKATQQELLELNRTLEEKVAQRTAEVQDLYENAPTGYHSINAEGKFVMVNQTELNWLGYAREEMIGHAVIDFVTESTRGVFQENFPLLVQRGWVKDVEFEFTCKDGSALPVLLNATAIYDESGNFIMTRSTIFDNTERKQAENELKRNVNFTSALLNAVPTPVFYKDKEGRYLGCNHAFVELMGKTPEEIYGKLTHEVWETAQADLYRQKDLDLMQANERQFYEAVITDKDGVVRPVIFVKDLFYDESGNVAGLVGAFIDISERKQAENAIRESEATYRALFENSNDGIFLMSSTGEELRANQRALDMVGYTLEEYLTLGHIKQNPFAREEDQRKDADDKLDALLRGETVPLYERIFTAKDGHKVPVEVNLSPVRDENGKIIMVQSVVRDIAERKAAEEALRSINKELERALLVKDEFLANMSHELRTPLNGILGFSEMLLSGQFGSLSERQSKYISSIENSGKHLLGLINDLLDLAKIEAGKLDVTLENVVISELCQSSLMFVKQMALNKNIQLSFEQDMTYPYVVGDQRRLKQILVNLLSNAVKFTPEHGRVTLRVVADPVKDCIDFAVEDTGIGISHADLLRLFKPFTQVDSSLARQHEGTGLGLALVQKLAELHGGGVSVQSEVDKGSTFTVCIPGRYMTGLEEKTEHPLPMEQERPTGQVARTGAKILLAEDIESNIVILGDYLEHQGYELIYAKNGQEALEKAKENLPNLILMDVQMPVMDGLEATRRLRADPRFTTLPIIALTALAMTGDRERCLEAGATEYVSKPTNLKRLSEMIASLINMER